MRAVEIRPSTLAGRKVVHHVRADLERNDPDFTEAGFVEAGTVMPSSGVLMEWAIGKQNESTRPTAVRNRDWSGEGGGFLWLLDERRTSCNC